MNKGIVIEKKKVVVCKYCNGYGYNVVQINYNDTEKEECYECRGAGRYKVTIKEFREYFE